MQDPSQMSDAELLAALGVQQPQAQQPVQAPANAPRGIRNNNPGNVEDGAFARSLPGYAGSDGRFARFSTPEAGANVAPALLQSYHRRGFDTPNEIINRWAPPSDNNPTQAYAQYVAQRVGVDVNQPISQDQIPLVAAAIKEFENGQRVNGPQQAPAEDPSALSDEALLAALQQQDANPQYADPSSGAITVEAVDPREEDRAYQQAKLQEQLRANTLRDAGVGPDALSFSTPLNDEMAGAAGYLTQGIDNLGRRLTGRDIETSAATRARAATDVYRERQDIFAQQNPAQAATGAILGGMAFAPARAAGALAPAQNFIRSSAAFARPTIAQGYGQAGAIGAAYGAADAEGGAGGRALGAVTGGLGGLATAGLIDAGGGIVGGMLNRGPRVPASERRVGEVLQRELRSNRVNPQDVLSSLNGAPDGSLPFNVNDGALASVAEVLASNPGPGGRIVRQAVDTQRAGSGDRILSRVGTEIGGEGNYFATLNNSIETRRQAANQVIDQIGPQTYRPNEQAVNALRSDYARQALQTQLALKAASPDPLVRAQADRLRPVIASLGSDVAPAIALDVRTAQDVSRALLDASSDAWRSSNGGLGQLLGDIGKAVRTDARQQVGGYDQWLRRYGDESSQIEALETGRRIFRNADDPSADGMSAEVLRTQFNEMSDTAKDMFRKGVGEALVARARTSRGGVGAMRDLVRSQEFSDRVRIAFPDEQAFTRFLNAAEAEVGMANTGAAISGNSRTAPRQAAARRLGAQDVQQGADTLSQATLTGIPLALGRAGIRGAGRLIGRNRSVLENDSLNELLGRAVTEPDLLRQMLNRPARRGLFSGRAPAGLAGTAPQAIPGF